jgi:phosphoglycerate transport regulatory protein PgtC
VKEGKAVFGLTIVFFAASAKANGAPVEMIYPERTAFLPAHIAMIASTRQAEDAQAFIHFALSKDGRKLMMERDSMRHPARPTPVRRSRRRSSTPSSRRAMSSSLTISRSVGDARRSSRFSSISPLSRPKRKTPRCGASPMRSNARKEPAGRAPTQ